MDMSLCGGLRAKELHDGWELTRALDQYNAISLHINKSSCSNMKGEVLQQSGAPHAEPGTLHTFILISLLTHRYCEKVRTYRSQYPFLTRDRNNCKATLKLLIAASRMYRSWNQQSEGRPPQKEHNSGVVFLTKSLAEGRSNLFFYHFRANSVNWVLKLRTDQHQMYDLSPLQELGLYNCREIKDPWLQTDKTNVNKTHLLLTRSRSPPHHV